MISQNRLVCALAPWVWEKDEQCWDKTAGHKGLSELLLLLGLGTLSHCCTGLQSFATSGSCWFCPFLQPALPAPLGASAAKFGPSCRAVLGNNQWRKTRWKRSIWEAFSQKTKDTASSMNFWSRVQPKQSTSSTTGICTHLFACPAQVMPVRAKYPTLSMSPLAFPWMDNSGKHFGVRVWTHAPACHAGPQSLHSRCPAT